MAFFLSFEGIDGCGKTTQLSMLHEYLTAQGQSVVTTREPGGTELAETIRNYLLHSRQALHKHTELLLFGAARAQHVDEIIRPALQSGVHVLSDRFTDSSLAYQGAGLGLDQNWIRSLNSFATGDLKPDLTIIFDVPLGVAKERRSKEKDDRIEARGMDYQERVRQGFLELAGQEPERVVVLSGAETPETIHQQVLRLLWERNLITTL